MHRPKGFVEWAVLIAVVAVALVVVALSAGNTFKLASELRLNPYLTAGLVELLFSTLLFLRGRQRALGRNVPVFLTIGYYVSFGFVTAVNVCGLAQINLYVGPPVGIAISSALWLMENLLVWFWTDSHKPHQETLREKKRRIKREIREEKEIQKLEYLKYEASLPDLKLVEIARAAQKKREEVLAEGLPDFFKREPVKEVIAEPVTAEPVKKEEPAIVPIRKRPIGFHAEMEEKKPPRFTPNLEARAKAIKTAERLQEELGRIPKKAELMKQGLTEHYSKYAIKTLKARETVEDA
jgi:hypothetical protein